MNPAQFFIHLFVPHHSNNHKARIISSQGLAVLAIGFFLLQFSLNLFTRVEGTGAVLGYASNISKSEVINITNQKRAEVGLAPLKENPRLSDGALEKGKHMLEKDYWAHISPDGVTPWKFFQNVSYKYKYAGENLARDFSTAPAAVNAWMASPTHKDNMLSAKYKEIGIGVVEGDLGGVDTTIIVQFFGTSMTDFVASGNAPARATPAPIAIATPVPTPQIILAANSVNNVLVSPFQTTKSISTILIFVLLAAFVIDIIVIARRRIERVSGRSLAHVSYLGMILAILLIIEAGRIL